MPPTAPIARDPIVLLLFVDAMRADVLTRREARGELPALADLAARSVRFDEARSPGSQTVYTFSAVFASRYFSQMWWTPKPPDGPLAAPRRLGALPRAARAREDPHGDVRELALVDREIGRIEQAVERLGLAARTTLVVSSDHGDAFGEHGTTDHGVTLYDELLRVPLLVRSPGAAPRAVQTPVSLVDLGPTVLDLMGLPTPGAYMGQTSCPSCAARRRRRRGPSSRRAGSSARWCCPTGSR